LISRRTWGKIARKDMGGNNVERNEETETKKERNKREDEIGVLVMIKEDTEGKKE